MNRAKETITFEYEHRIGMFKVVQVKNTTRFLPGERYKKPIVDQLISEAKANRIRPLEVVIKGTD